MKHFQTTFRTPLHILIFHLQPRLKHQRHHIQPVLNVGCIHISAHDDGLLVPATAYKFEKIHQRRIRCNGLEHRNIFKSENSRRSLPTDVAVRGVAYPFRREKGAVERNAGIIPVAYALLHKSKVGITFGRRVVDQVVG